ncbi:L-cysteine desulfidase family protein [Anaerosalibacter sp. Marseille-P3206]|uniref:L-cysteine desulfidase family protein n=1 Tax=Anaerosalibacter sp. Marseille-P3206 TaxID=1871005 RepID=UPI001F2DA770|nr:L-serine ammonia-lyase, iron-sulfur-dependent, subunit alpha [Anaerosalibacter sp. Marseille-P3206]
METNMMKDLINMVKQDAVPALGCTEPVAVAYAGAATREYIRGNIEYINIEVSKNIYKNGKSVMIPNTDEWGLDLAAALGVLGGDKEDGLMVLRKIDKKIVDAAHEMLKEEKVKVNYVEDVPDVFVRITVKSDDEIEAVLKNCHTHIETVKVNGETVFENKTESKDKVSSDFLKKLSFVEIREICETIPIEELDFIEDGIKMNKNAAETGLNWDKGLKAGATLKRLQDKGILCNDAPTRARVLTAASADIRMGGGDCPIMTSGGSGNQGLGVVLPITVVAEEKGIEKERLMRAVFFAHVINKYVKIYTGKLSSMCGCAIAAGIGASAGITWLLGGNDEQIQGACQNMLSNLTGMICDGAKETCSLKLSTSAGEAVIAAYLAIENVIVRSNTGIIGETIEDTIRNLGILCRDGLAATDSVIIDIIR